MISIAEAMLNNTTAIITARITRALTSWVFSQSKTTG